MFKKLDVQKLENLKTYIQSNDVGLIKDLLIIMLRIAKIFTNDEADKIIDEIIAILEN